MLIALGALSACQPPWDSAAPCEGLGDELTSALTGTRYSLCVHLPEAYDAESTYPIVYYLDGDWSHEPYQSAVSRTAGIPPLIAVGIGYGDGENHRNRDYVWPADHSGDFAGSGGGDVFYAFLRDELTPWVEARWFPAGPSVIAGHSIGGYFALYAMFRSLIDGDGLLDGAVAGSPALHVSDGWLFELEGQLGAAPASVFLSMGEYDSAVMNIYADEMAARLADRDAIAVKFERYPSATHDETASPSVTDGLAFVLGSR